MAYPHNSWEQKSHPIPLHLPTHQMCHCHKKRRSDDVDAPRGLPTAVVDVAAKPFCEGGCSADRVADSITDMGSRRRLRVSSTSLRSCATSSRVTLPVVAAAPEPLRAAPLLPTVDGGDGADDAER